MPLKNPQHHTFMRSFHDNSKPDIIFAVTAPAIPTNPIPPRHLAMSSGKWRPRERAALSRKRKIMAIITHPFTMRDFVVGKNWWTAGNMVQHARFTKKAWNTRLRQHSAEANRKSAIFASASAPTHAEYNTSVRVLQCIGADFFCSALMHAHHE